MSFPSTDRRIPERKPLDWPAVLHWDWPALWRLLACSALVMAAVFLLLAERA